MDQPTYEQTITRIRSRWDHLDELLPLLGQSPAIELAMRRAQMAANSACNFLIHGPPNIGKRQIAQGIFQNRLSQRKESESAHGQFFPVDLSVVDGEMLDGMLEVFAGRIRSTDLPELQLLILEHLDELSEGGLQAIQRFLKHHSAACTIAGLCEHEPEVLSRRGTLWRQLLAGMADIEVLVPPLSERREDIPVLLDQALAAYCRTAERALLKFSPAAMELLVGFEWPQNLRQVRSTVESSVDQAMLTNEIDVHHLPVEIRTYASSIHSSGSGRIDPVQLDELLEEFERTLIKRALTLSPRNRAQVARWLGISRPRLLRRISQLGLEGMSGEEDVQDGEQ